MKDLLSIRLLVLRPIGINHGTRIIREISCESNGNDGRDLASPRVKLLNVALNLVNYAGH